MNAAKRLPLIVASMLLAVPTSAQRSFSTGILAETFGHGEQTKNFVAFEDLDHGCEIRDCIPSIDDPEIVVTEQAKHAAKMRFSRRYGYSGSRGIRFTRKQS